MQASHQLDSENDHAATLRKVWSVSTKGNGVSNRRKPAFAEATARQAEVTEEFKTKERLARSRTLSESPNCRLRPMAKPTLFHREHRSTRNFSTGGNGGEEPSPPEDGVAVATNGGLLPLPKTKAKPQSAQGVAAFKLSQKRSSDTDQFGCDRSAQKAINETRL
jgi:hypothetical protein